MKQVLQDLRAGHTLLVDTPAPEPRPSELLIATRASVLSAGTERMLVDFGRGGLIDKVRQQPDKVRQVIDKIRSDGLIETLEAVKSKLDEPLPMGYCNAGVVVRVGANVQGFSVGDRVVSNGAHAELVCVPHRLCARIPDSVPDETAAFAVLGAIALQGVRLSMPTLGEVFVVSGLGLIGLLAVQLLRASGGRVIGLDFNPQRLEIAQAFGAEVVQLGTGMDPVTEVTRRTGGRGADGVLIAASTESDEPVRQAAQMSRKRGRIVLLGVTGLELSRADFYQKELTFQVSCSYGPGRYDPAYEEQGNDYPIGFVRWTEQRNFEAVLDAMDAGRVDTSRLVTHRFPIAQAVDAYEVLATHPGSLGIVFEYPKPVSATLARTVALGSAPAVSADPSVSAIGAGNYASRMLLPALAAAGFSFDTLATRGSAQSTVKGGRLGFRQVTTDVDAALNSPSNLIVIATRHDSHADLAIRALRTGKHVFVEKPIAVNYEELARLEEALHDGHRRGLGGSLTVGFNRRFAPHVVKARKLLAGRPGPRAFLYTVNAGAIPASHWTQDREQGGGRVIGEVCHFIDLLRFLAGATIVRAHAIAMSTAGSPSGGPDTVAIELSFGDGSIGSIHYLSNGSRAFPKERLEIFAGGAVLRLDNFRRLEAFGWPRASNERLWRQDKGQRAMALAMRDRVAGGQGPVIPIEEILEVARVTLDCAAQTVAR